MLEEVVTLPQNYIPRRKTGMTSKRYLSFGLLALTVATVVGCGPKPEVSRVQAIIEEAQTLDRNELYAKAIEELHGKEMNAVGNSSRGKTAQEYFIEFLKGRTFNTATSAYEDDAAVRAAFPQYKADLNAKINWTQPKNNQIFAQIANDVRSANPTLSMTLIQDGSQIQSKMIETGNLLNYIPKEWNGNVDTNGKPFALQSLNKVFMYNNLNEDKTFNNMWDFVREGEKPMFMGPESEPVGKNALLMMTREDYSNVIKEAYDALTGAEKTRIDAVVTGTATEKGTAAEALDLGLTHANAKYALAWIKLWIKQYNKMTDDGPIMVELAKNTAVGESGLLVYSKLRSIGETELSSKKNVEVAAYNSGYKGLGGFMYKHYLQVLKTSPLPWTSVAFIHYMTTTMKGFEPWGKDIGGYSSDPAVTPDHSKDGKGAGTDAAPEFPVLNDRGYTWWTTNEAGKGRLVIEDPVYASSVSYTVGDWISLI